MATALPMALGARLLRGTRLLPTAHTPLPLSTQNACREAPRVTAARLAPLWDSQLLVHYAEVFTGTYKVAAARMRAAMEDTNAGLQWVWAEVPPAPSARPAGAASDIDFNALEWNLM